MKNEYGAPIERGRVKDVTQEGARVESLSRPGITTPPIKAIQGTEVQADDTVCFFMFSDGKGMIIAKAEDGQTSNSGATGG